MELTLVGLQNAGKSTLTNALCGDTDGTKDTIPTVGFNMRKTKKGNVDINFFDIGGQSKYRSSMWSRYCRGAGAIIYVVDSADESHMEEAARELKNLLENPALKGIPLLVVGNKNDLPGSLTSEEVAQHMRLDTVKDRIVSCYSISAKNAVNIDKTLEWLIKHGKQKQ